MDTERLLDTFLDLVQINSPSGHEERIIHELYKLTSGMGVTAKKYFYGNLILKKKGFGGPLLLSAHVDTVEPGRGVRPIVESGDIMSSGNTILGADNKIAVACMIELLRVLKENDRKHRSLEIIFTRSEEVGSLGAVNLDYAKIKSKTGYIFDSANPIGTIIIASPFYNRFDIEIVGKAAHASLPNKAVNALSVFSKAYAKMEFGKISENTLINIGFINGGSVRNTIPGKVELKGEVRSFKEEEIEKYSKLYIREFYKLARMYGGKIKSSLVRENGGYQYSSSDDFLKITKDILKKSGIAFKLKKVWGCSDANIFIGHHIKVLNLGNGSINPHTKNESVSVANLHKLIQLMLSLVSKTQ